MTDPSKITETAKRFTEDMNRPPLVPPPQRKDEVELADFLALKTLVTVIINHAAAATGSTPKDYIDYLWARCRESVTRSEPLDAQDQVAQEKFEERIFESIDKTLSCIHFE